jgi:16S rRNA (cytosine967-C5)-methyltransferase
MIKNERIQALSILIKVISNKIALTYLFVPEHSPFTKALCFGVCRHYRRLQAIADCMLTTRPLVLEVWLTLLLGLYQLHFLNKPDYTVVQETVAMLDVLKKSWAKGLINAVLRRFCRERDDIINTLAQNNDYCFGHPTWLLKSLKNDWPTCWQTILIGNDAHPPMTLRVNQRHQSQQAYLKRLKKVGIEAKCALYSPVAIILKSPCAVSELPGFAHGDVSVQDEAAQLAVSLLNLKPRLRVLDACCAPGGKTCHILEAEPALAQCLALDSDKQRLERVYENLRRLKLHAQIQQADALMPSDWWDGQLFDRILLDVPCSATGVIRRHPDIKLLRSAADIATIVPIQQALLQQMWQLLAPGGLLVYATCSIMKQENEQQIKHFLSIHTDCQVDCQTKPWANNTGYGWQLIPGHDELDGFFYSVLSKRL